jgi:hypothetical protein
MGGMIAQELGPRSATARRPRPGRDTAGGLADPKNPHANPALVEQIRKAVTEDFRAVRPDVRGPDLQAGHRVAAPRLGDGSDAADAAARAQACLDASWRPICATSSPR